MYTHLILGGGGMKGAAIIGALKVLYKKNLLDNLQTYIGSSVGALVCFLLNIGYTHKELKDIMLNIEFGEYVGLSLSHILDNWGLNDCKSLMKLIVGIIKQKNISPNITFGQLYENTNKILIITGSELLNNECIYYNYENYKDMKILDAIRITISYPVIFDPNFQENNIFIDGGLFAPYPIDYFANIENKIGIIINNKYNNNKIESFEDYLMAIIISLEERYEKFYLKNYEKDTIIIDIKDVYSMNFKLDKNDKYAMYKIGIQCAKNYLQNNNIIQS
jgi:predicted acylesterase/phospholipase RssA